MNERILIADDEEMICSIIGRRLAKEGYSCVTARNGKEALDYFYKDDFWLIISDFQMPGMNGMELLKQVRAVNPSMIVIMITAYPEIDLAIQAMRLGAYNFIIKPIDLDLLVFSVQRALEKKRLEEEIKTYHFHLEKMVEERTAKLHQAYIGLKRAHLDSVRVLINAIDAKDPYTQGHSDKVRKMSIRMGAKLDFNEERLENLGYGALLHDIGKIGIRDEVLQKRDHLDADEYQYIQEHTLIGVKIVEGIDFFKEKIPVIRHHHERFDGKGYPDGLTGEAIPLEARIVAVPDAFDAMTSFRSYRETVPLESVLIEMERGDGTQFDPDLLKIFLQEEIFRDGPPSYLS